MIDVERLSKELKHLLNADYINLESSPSSIGYSVGIAYSIPTDIPRYETLGNYRDGIQKIIKDLGDRIANSAVQSENEILQLKIKDMEKQIETLQEEMKADKKYKTFYELFKGLRTNTQEIA